MGDRTLELRAQDLAVTIGRRTIFSKISVVCRPGTMTLLVGPSGCGKTTLLHCLGLLQRPSSGSIAVDGAETTDWGEGRRRRFWSESCSFVLQDYGLIDEESVALNVSMRASILRRRAVVDARRLTDALAKVSLQGHEQDLVSHLSGGEKQRVAVARALYRDTSLVLVDEPTASLDVDNRNRIVQLLDVLRHEGRTVVVATHDELLMAEADVIVQVGGSQQPSEERALPTVSRAATTNGDLKGMLSEN